MIVTTLHPGYFAYNPTYQQELHVLFALLGSLESLAESMVAKAGSWSNTAAEAVAVEIQSIVQQTELAGECTYMKYDSLDQYWIRSHRPTASSESQGA